MKRVIFMTNQTDLFETARRYFSTKSIQLVQGPVSQFTQSENDLQDMVSKKVQKAYHQVQEPCFIIEESFMIDALQQFPGTHLSYVLKTIGTDGILKLMDGKTNRNCTYRRCLGYYDGREKHYFFSDETGTLAIKKVGDPKTHLLNQIFIPTAYQVYLETSNPSRLAVEKCQPDCIEQFANYLQTHPFGLIDEPYFTNE